MRNLSPYLFNCAVQPGCAAILIEAIQAESQNTSR